MYMYLLIKIKSPNYNQAPTLPFAYLSYIGLDSHTYMMLSIETKEKSPN